MNATQFAKHRNVKPSLVSKWIKTGMLDGTFTKNGQSYDIDHKAADAKLEASLHPSYRRQAATTDTDQENDTGPSFAEARRQKEHHLAELRKLELEEKRGQLVPATEVQALLEKLIAQSRVKLLGIKSQIAPLVHEAIGDAAQRECLLTSVETIINETLLDLSNASI